MKRIILLIILLIIFSINVSATNNTQTHNASEIYPKTFPVGDYEFQGNLTLTDKIIFKLGEYMDNLVNGWFRVFGNINLMQNKIENVSVMNASTIYGDNVTIVGNITSENVFLPSYVSSHTNDTIAVATAGKWYNVTFDHETDEIKERITHTFDDDTNQTFTIVDDGVYEITYSCTFQDSTIAPNSHVVTRVVKNNVELNGFTQEEDLGLQDQDKTIAHSDLVSLSTGDTIELQFTSDDTTVSLTGHLTYGSHLNTGHINIKKMYRKPG